MMIQAMIALSGMGRNDVFGQLRQPRVRWNTTDIVGSGASFRIPTGDGATGSAAHCGRARSPERPACEAMS